MAEPFELRRARVEAVLAAARRIRDASDELGQRARALLVDSTGLSLQNVELALAECLEVEPSREELAALCAVVPRAPGAHVLLSANVWVAAHRAIVIALAASEHVFVRPSRREPHLAELLHAAGAPIQLVNELQPKPGDHVWAYGSDQTLDALAQSLDPEVVLHAHGSGVGLALLEAAAIRDFDEVAEALARDVVLFDQRGCLSPRAALVLGTPAQTEAFARALAAALGHFAERVPRGRLSREELADEVRYRDATTYAMQLFVTAQAAVSVDRDGAAGIVIPPPGRNVHVMRAQEIERLLIPHAPLVTAVGVRASRAVQREIERALPEARLSAIGVMQSPPLDGPVDRRRRDLRPRAARRSRG